MDAFLTCFLNLAILTPLGIFFKSLQMWNNDNFEVNNPDYFVDYVYTDDIEIVEACKI